MPSFKAGQLVICHVFPRSPAGIRNRFGCYSVFKSMQTCVALLRGVNVSGKKTVPMNELKRLFVDSGFVNVVTYLNSGNVVFQSDKDTNPRIRGLIEANLERRFGFEIKVIVLGLGELERYISRCPYDEKKLSQGEVIYFTLLSSAPSRKAVNEMKTCPDETDDFVVAVKVVYLVAGHGYSKTRYNNAFFEKAFRVDATTRNINTLRRISEIGLELD